MCARKKWILIILIERKKMVLSLLIFLSHLTLKFKKYTSET